MHKSSWHIKRIVYLLVIFLICVLVVRNSEGFPETLKFISMMLLVISICLLGISVALDLFNLFLYFDTKNNGTVEECPIIAIQSNPMGYSCAVVEFDGKTYYSSYYPELSEDLIGTTARLKIHPLFPNYAIVEIG